METSSPTNEPDNLVLFPSSKNFVIDADISDPIADLLNEYTYMSESDIPGHLDDRFEDFDLEVDLEDTSVFGSLEAFMNRNQSNDNLTPDDKLVKLINDRIQSIIDAKARIKFYLEEIEMFLPRRR